MAALRELERMPRSFLLPEGSPSLLDLGGMPVELTEMFGRQVDLKTWGLMSERVRKQVERERQVQYAA